MFGGGFIQQMVNTMRDNRALQSSRKQKNRNSDDRRAGKTKLKFPKGNPERMKKNENDQKKIWSTVQSSMVTYLYLLRTFLWSNAHLGVHLAFSISVCRS